MSDISERAEALAKAHPFAEVVENTFLGFFKVLGLITGGFVLGVSWLAFHAWTVVFIVWLAFSDGFKAAARVHQPDVNQVAERIAPLPNPAATHLLDDPRYQDHTTPFGVPYGPNVHASHE
jgi:hypothetical protein